MLNVCEMFRSLQGEGVMIGLPTYFVRLTGCNLACRWCDTKYSNEEEGESMSVDDIIDIVKDDRIICITGGEPLLQDDVYELMERLLQMDKVIVLETNGSIDLSKVPKHKDLMISMDVKCPSSEMEDSIHMPNIALLKPTDQLKFVIGNGDDLEYSLEFMASNKADCNIVFCPVGGMDIEPLAEEVVERRLDVRVLPQLHKIIWGNKRSV